MSIDGVYYTNFVPDCNKFFQKNHKKFILLPKSNKINVSIYNY